MPNLPPDLSRTRRYSSHAAGRSHGGLSVARRKPDLYWISMPRKPDSHAARLKRVIPRLRGKRIGVLGDLMLDRYLWGTASRLSPEAAVPVVDFVEQSECLGGAGNVAA